MNTFYLDLHSHCVSTSSCSQKPWQRQTEWIHVHLKHSRCWDQSPQVLRLLYHCLARPFHNTPPLQAYPWLLNHLYCVVHHHTVIPKLLLRFLSSRPLLQFSLVSPSQALTNSISLLTPFLQSWPIPVPLSCLFCGLMQPCLCLPCVCSYRRRISSCLSANSYLAGILQLGRS